MSIFLVVGICQAPHLKCFGIVKTVSLDLLRNRYDCFTYIRAELIRLLHLVSKGTNMTAPDSYDFTCDPEQSYLFLLTPSEAVKSVLARTCDESKLKS